MAKIDSAYAYYVSNYAHKEVSRYDSHKKSDLRKVYNKIIRQTKSPLCTKFPTCQRLKSMPSILRKVLRISRTPLLLSLTAMALLRTLSRKRSQYLLTPILLM